MVTVDSPNVDRYLEDLPRARGETLSQVRALVLETAPEAEEAMRYRMPTTRSETKCYVLLPHRSTI
jgi:uncharacterized protein YdhG (YjbR/CyaY superfamily)